MLTKGFRVLVRGDDLDSGDPGLRPILFLAAAVLATGVSGAFLDFIHLAATLEAAPDPTGQQALVAFVSISALLSVSLLVAMAGGLCWFVLTQWLSFHAGARAQLLGVGRHLSWQRSTPS